LKKPDLDVDADGKHTGKKPDMDIDIDVDVLEVLLNLILY